MRTAQSLLLALAILSPLSAFAYTTDEVKAETLIKNHQTAVQKYATTHKKAMPAIEEYKYGMKLDVAKVIRKSPDLKTCSVMPKLMTYQNSKGDLKTVQYQVLSGCLNSQ
ncbi:hypothetical protein BTW15_24150 [Pseudomonas syringae pv. tomato]|uniref:DUF2790 domain-containing protein n=1 Tax=Pseudomonas syringae pv. tomato TaxID=323 RepID=A0AB36KNR1_PSEUB|nr:MULTISPECIES: DUF2790 domain-containing protein [Pseudomonas syringae group]KPB80006.1 Uncharacterized protein AC505_5824 [Pseudomonas syringae pv. maculicola]MBI6851052.1 DUF2790 domain-containing protein [Pseudomonas syringae]MBX6509926.1 DUF2790 domain-containing protein [Pseudomonas syringae pv. tomato]OPE57490.1 hypothetical protein BTW15_24150 [Pseudomonas syringae pv. tomato]RMV02425.1 hypothetical protein ALP19_04482 [Pseudomonas syringae pv. tomato]